MRLKGVPEREKAENKWVEIIFEIWENGLEWKEHKFRD